MIGGHYWRPDADITPLTAKPVVTMPTLRDGSVMLTYDHVLVGTRPLTDLEQAGRDARLAVRRGMADVLEWLGQRVHNEPTGAEVIAELKALADPARCARGRHAA